MKNLFNSIKILGILLIVGLGVSYVSAYTPGGTFSTGQVPAVINTSTTNQTKIGGLLSDKFMVANLGFFTKTLLPGNDSWMNIGGTEPLTSSGINNGGSTIPLTFDLTGRAKVTKAGTQGQDAINFISGQAQCSTATAFINDRATAFEFTSGGNADTGHADLIARQLQLSGGTPQDNSVLAAVDNQGNAVWAKLVVQNGVLKVIDNKTGLPIPSSGVTSPVVTDADCTPPPNTTYAWTSGNWSTCTTYSGSDWHDFYATSGVPWGTVGQSCTAWINSQIANNGSQTRDVVCKDSNGNIVADSMCTGTKPDTTKSCTVPMQVRVKVTVDNMGAQTINYTDPGQCLYSKLINPTSTDPLGNLFALDCQVRTTSQSTPGGFSPSSSCSLLNFTGGPGYGFNAGNPGGWTATGSALFQLQVKPQ